MNSANSRRLVGSLAGWLALVLMLGASPVVAADKTNPPILTVSRIFESGDFAGDGFSARWLADSSGYSTDRKSVV